MYKMMRRGQRVMMMAMQATHVWLQQLSLGVCVPPHTC
jgi:hypothetical protein